MGQQKRNVLKQPGYLRDMLNLPNQTGFYRGKVRDVYSIGGDHLVMVVSNRISAFDVVLPRPIPHKGAVLNGIAAQMLDATADIVPNWKVSVPAPNATIGHRCEPYGVEMVVRGYLTGHAWRTYKTSSHLPRRRTRATTRTYRVARLSDVVSFRRTSTLSWNATLWPSTSVA
jgi:phosphoribosylaminoimidazole-succinocarboxamide synthase